MLNEIEQIEKCGRKCFDNTHKEAILKMKNKSTSIKNFIEKINKSEHGVKIIRSIDKNTISFGYDKCCCKQVNHKNISLPLNYCQCCVGFSKQFLEIIFEKPVDLEILKTIINGAESCEFIVHL